MKRAYCLSKIDKLRNFWLDGIPHLQTIKDRNTTLSILFCSLQMCALTNAPSYSYGRSMCTSAGARVHTHTQTNTFIFISILSIFVAMHMNRVERKTGRGRDRENVNLPCE